MSPFCIIQLGLTQPASSSFLCPLLRVVNLTPLFNLSNQIRREGVFQAKANLLKCHHFDRLPYSLKRNFLLIRQLPIIQSCHFADFFTRF